MARPDKLTPELLKAAKAYLKRKKSGSNGKMECPFVEELAVMELDVHRHTVENWCANAEDKAWLKKQKPAKRKLYLEFLDTVKKLATMQLLYLKVRGIDDGRNAVAIFLMKANHKMVETSRHEFSGPDGQPMEFKAIEVMGSIKGGDK
jgi:hypothetical protein